MSARLPSSVFWRSLLIQGAWNYQGMQHLGYLWALLPIVRQLPKDERRAALLRATEFYNAHPYLCGYLLGAASTLEATGQGPALSRLKRAGVTPLGVTGDRLFWAGLKPLSGVLGMLGFLVLVITPPVADDRHWLTALGVAVAATVGYNVIHVHWRRKALHDGRRLGLGLAGALRELAHLPLLAASGLALGLISGLTLPLLAAMGAGGKPLGVLALLATAVLSWQLPARSWALPVLLAAVFLFQSL